MLLLVVLISCVASQFEWVTDQHVQRMMKEEGFYKGDVDAEWNDESKAAYIKFASQDSIFVNPNTYNPHQSRYAKQRVGSWVLEHDVSAIRPRSVGVFFIQFNIEKGCTGGEVSRPECMTAPDRVNSALNVLFRAPEQNTQHFFSLATRGLHRFNYSEAAVHHFSLSSKDTKSLGVQFLIRDLVRWDPLQRYNRAIFVMPPEFAGMGIGTAGMASENTVYLKVVGITNSMHEIGHTLGLQHCGAISRGRYDEYGARTSIMSGMGTQGMNAVELDWLRVINHNVLALVRSQSMIEIKSLTSISAGYVPGVAYSPIAGFVAAVYKSSNDGPEYFIEHREQIRQDRELDSQFLGALLVHHSRQYRETELDAVIKIGQSWTSPRGDLKITHVGPKVGTFDVLIGPVTNPDAIVSSWTRKDFLASFRN
jgi:hypothetical protein